MKKRLNEDYYYYKNQLDRVAEKHDRVYPFTILVHGTNGKTHHLSLNTDSINAMIDWLKENKLLKKA